MKKTILFFIFTSLATVVFSQNVPIQISYQYINVEKGYDHSNKARVYIDGQLIAESPAALESKKMKMMVQVPEGKHEIKVMTLAYYEGSWEEHTVANEYSIDGFVITERFFKKKEKLNIIFDINHGTTYAWNSKAMVQP